MVSRLGLSRVDWRKSTNKSATAAPEMSLSLLQSTTSSLRTMRLGSSDTCGSCSIWIRPTTSCP